MRLGTHTGTAAKNANEPARRYPRALLSVLFGLRHLIGGGIHTTRGITLDISEGGVGALVKGELRLGETVELDLYLPERTMNTVAIVRHTSSVRSGFEFLGLTPEERSQISSSYGHHRISLS